MFREMRRKNRAISLEDACELLKSERRGVFAVNGEGGYPFAFPINYLYDEEANKIYFHGAKRGLKVDAISNNDRVCFTVMGNERKEPGEEWAPYVQSAIVYGRCRVIEDAVPYRETVRRFALKYYPSETEADKELDQALKAMALFVIDIEHITGKQIQER